MYESVKLETPCEVINVTPFNPLISHCQIKVCYVGDNPNRNKSIITKEVAIEMANTLPGSPIVGFYNQYTKDFEEHNQTIKVLNGKLKFEDTTRPYGFVDLNAKVWFQDYLDGDTVHTYLVTEGWLWTGQYPEAKRIVENGNGQSMELDKPSLHGSWTFDNNSGMRFFIINDAIISKLCVLGDDFEPCFEGGSITNFSLDDEFNNKIYALMKEVRELKGGNLTVEDINKKPEEELNENLAPEGKEEPAEGATPQVDNTPAEPEVKEPAADEGVQNDPEPQAGEKPAEEQPKEDPQEGEGENAQFSLSDFQTLQESYSNLEEKYNELQTKFTAMKESYDSLIEFKNSKDREEKQEMIDRFYMLSEEDKKDVQENIDKYSLDEIESKLCIICVHNKLDMSEKQDNENNNPTTTFNLDEVDDDAEDTNVPALVSLLRKNRKNEN